MNDQLHCGHICAAAFLTFSGQLRTTSAEDFHKREREGGGGEREREGRERERERERGRERGGTGGQGGKKRERERERGGGGETIMSAEDNALNTTFRDLGLSKQRRKTENIEISM